MDTDASGTINIKELIDFLTALGGDDIDKDEVTNKNKNQIQLV